MENSKAKGKKKKTRGPGGGRGQLNGARPAIENATHTLTLSHTLTLLHSYTHSLISTLSLSLMPLPYPLSTIDFVSVPCILSPHPPLRPPSPPPAKQQQLHSFGFRRHRLWPFIERCGCRNYDRPRNSRGMGPERPHPRKPNPWPDRRWILPLILIGNCYFYD